MPAEARRPGVLALEVTPRCHRSCLYCYNAWRGEDLGGEPPLPTASLVPLVEAALAASGRGGVQLTGGEPLLREDLWELVAALRRPGRSLSLVTDGALLDDAAADRLRALGVGPVQPTLLAADAVTHDGLKGARCFDDTVRAIRRLLERRIPVTVSFVCTRVNHACFPEVLELCFALGVRSVAFSRLCDAGEASAHRASLAPDAGMIRGCLAAAEAASVRLGLKVHVAISLPHCVVDPAATPHLRFGGCALGTERPGFTIDPWGRLRACSVSPEVLGDLRTEPWDVIVPRARTGYLRQVTTVPKECASCPSLARCGGGCRESARTLAGRPGAPDPLVSASSSP